LNINLKEEDLNNLTTILEEKNISEEEFFRQAILEKLNKEIARYKVFC